MGRWHPFLHMVLLRLDCKGYIPQSVRSACHFEVMNDE